MAIVSILDEMKRLNAADAQHINLYGEQVIGVSGNTVQQLLAVDGLSLHKTTPKIIQLYEYASSWRHSTIELHWPNPKCFRAMYESPSVAQTIRQDFEKGSSPFEEYSNSQCVLFAIDDEDIIFQRAYMLFEPDEKEAKIIDIGSGINLFQDIEGYLKFWLEVFQSRSTN